LQTYFSIQSSGSFPFAIYERTIKPVFVAQVAGVRCHFGANSGICAITKRRFVVNRLVRVVHFPKMGYFLCWEIIRFKKVS
jgi:hypothetical protein